MDPTSIVDLYTAQKSSFVAALGMLGLSDDACKAAFCTVLAYELTPYGPEPSTNDLNLLLAAPTLACDRYVTVAWLLADLLHVPGDFGTAVGWDEGAVGNHAQLLFDDGHSRLLLDPTIGLIVNGVTIEGLSQGTRYSEFASFYARDDITPFNTQVISAVEGGLFHVRDAIYYVPGLDNWINFYSDYQGMKLDQLDGSKILVGSIGSDPAIIGTEFGDFIYGGKGDDNIDGGAGDDYIEGGNGDDYIDGNSGLDTVVFIFPRSEFSISGDAYNVVIAGDSTGTDRLTNVEYLKFSDQVLPLTAHTVVQSDENFQFTWSEAVTFFDAAWNRLQVSYRFEDDQEYIYQYDALSQFNWTSVETSFDTQGRQSQIIYNNDSGSMAVYQYDVTNVFAWASVQTIFDTESRREKVIYSNDDSTSVVYQYDLGGNFSWEQTARYFDAVGRKVQDVYVNDSGNYTVYDYDISGSVMAVYQYNSNWEFIS